MDSKDLEIGQESCLPLLFLTGRLERLDLTWSDGIERPG